MTQQSSEHIGIYPASFDPITVAHVGIAERAARTLDKLYVVVAAHPSKQSLFSSTERLSMVKDSISHIANAEAILIEDGLTVDHARQLQATVIIRGARSVTDFLDEISLFEKNLHVQQAVGIESDSAEFIDTITYYALPHTNHISSSLVRELLQIPSVEDRAKRLAPLIPAVIHEKVMSSNILQND